MPTYRKNESDREIDQFVDSITEGQVRILGPGGQMQPVKSYNGEERRVLGGVVVGNPNDRILFDDYVGKPRP